MTERDIFLAALDIEDYEARTAFVQERCGDDTELFIRVQGLLSSHESQSQFLRTPAVAQIAENADTAAAQTQHFSDSSTADEQLRDAPNSDATFISDHGDADDEIPLGYLSPSDREDSLGRLKHYEILEVIGRGAFGIVLKAFDESLQRVVAIKVLSPELAATSPARKRFRREAELSAAVRHENVVAIYAIEDDPIPYLVMEYIPGETLQQRLDGSGPLELLKVLTLGKQMCDGLAAAHAQGLIHRDIKPGNILLETSINDRVKLTDFGLARAADDASITRSGVIAGTPMYMAPEQALGQKLDQRADLFSLGSVLYQMVSGRPPFRAPSTVAVLKRVAEETPRPIQEIIPETPDWVCHLIGHLHAKDPEDRYQTAQEVSDLLSKHLDDLQNGRTPDVSAPAYFEQSRKATEPRESKRISHKSLTQAAAVVILLLVGLILSEATGVTRLVPYVNGSGTTPPPQIERSTSLVKKETSIAETGVPGPPDDGIPGSQEDRSDENWIVHNIIQRINPERDTTDNRYTGSNRWTKGGNAKNPTLINQFDEKPCKLIWPLEVTFPKYEFDIEVVRTKGNGGFTINIPDARDDTQWMLVPTADGKAWRIVLLVKQKEYQNDKLVDVVSGFPFVDGERLKFRFKVDRQAEEDTVTITVFSDSGDDLEGTWTGNLDETSTKWKEFPEANERLSFWIFAKNQFEFHRIQVRVPVPHLKKD